MRTNSKLRKGAGTASTCRRFVKYHGRRACASLLAVSMVVSNVSPAFAATDSSEDTSSLYEYEFDSEELYNALLSAIVEGDDAKTMEFKGSAAADYDELFSEENYVYKLNLDLDGQSDGDDLQMEVYARLNADEGVIINDLSEDEAEESYQLTGDEEFIFLLENSSGVEQSARIVIDGVPSEDIIAQPYSTVMADEEANPGPGAVETTDAVTDEEKTGDETVDTEDVVIESGTITVPTEDENPDVVIVDDTTVENMESNDDAGEENDGEPTETEVVIDDAASGDETGDDDAVNGETGSSEGTEEDADDEVTVEDTNDGDDEDGEIEDDISDEDGMEDTSDDADEDEADDSSDTDKDDTEEESDDEVAEVTASVSRKQVARVAASVSRATSSNATRTASTSDAEKATASNAKEASLDGSAYESAALGRHTVTAYVISTGSLSMEQDVEEEEEAVGPAIEGSCTDEEGVTISVNAPEGAFPAGTKLVITPLGNKAFDVSFRQYEDASDEDGEILDDEAEDGDYIELQPADGYSVSVAFTLPAIEELTAGQTAEVQVMHIDDNGTGEEVGEAVTVEAEQEVAVEVEAESFSVYAVVITPNGEEKVRTELGTYETIQAAINAAGSQEVSIKLLSDMEESVTVSDAAVTFDLNGHTWTGSTGTTLTSSKDITIVDNGETKGSMTAVSGYRAVTVNNASLTIDGVTMTGSGSIENEAMLNYKTGAAASKSGDYYYYSSNPARAGGIVLVNGGSLIVSDSSFSGGVSASENEMKQNSSGSVYGAYTIGGAVAAIGTVSSVSVNDSTFSENSVTSSYGYGGAVGVIVTTSTESVSITGSSFSGNTSGKYGGAVSIYTASGKPTTNITVSDSSFSENTASTAGGALYIYSGSATAAMSGNTFTSNSATGTSGGGAACVNVGTLSVSGDTYTSNTTAGNGGALNVTATTATVEGSTFTENTVTGNYSGGAVYAYNATLTVNDSNFTDNRATSYGGAIYANKNATITGGTFSGNSANKGGAIYFSGSSSTGTVSEATFTGNTAGYYGGALYFCGTGSVTNATLTGNSVTGGSGGAIYYYNSSKTLTVSGSTIKENKVSSQGGGIYAIGSLTLGSGNVITANHADKEGGGLYLYGSTSSIYSIDEGTKIGGNTCGDPNYTEAAVYVSASATGSKSTKTTNAAKSALNDMLSSLSVLSTLDGKSSEINNFTYVLSKYTPSTVSVSQGSKKTTVTTEIGYNSSVKQPAGIYLDSNESGKHESGTAEDGTEIYVASTITDALGKANELGVTIVYVHSTYTLTAGEATTIANSGIIWTRDACNTDAVFSISGNVTLTGVKINGANVEATSALVTVSSGNSLTIEEGTEIYSGVNLKGHGGGVSVSQASFTMNGGKINGNKAKKGAGVYVYSNNNGSNVQLMGGEISNNTATSYGGGMYIGYCDSTIGKEGVKGSGTTFSANSGSMGGGIFYNHGTHYVYAAKFTNNTATRESGSYYDGGGIYIESGTTVYMQNVYATGNKSTATSLNNKAAIACCPTGELAVYEVNGAYVDNNSDDDFEMCLTSLLPEPDSDPTAYISDVALGGADNNFTHYGVTAEKSYYQYTKSNFNIKANTSDEAEDLAAASATVIFTGNSCTQDGSAIMTNGTLIIGSPRKSLTVEKEWDGEKGTEVLVQLQYKLPGGEWTSVSTQTRKDAIQILSKENNWTYTWSNLGYGTYGTGTDEDKENTAATEIQWRVIEANVTGYKNTSESEMPAKNGEYDNIDGQAYKQTITNTKDENANPGTLTVSKIAEGLADGETFTFAVTLGNLSDNTYLLSYTDASGELQTISVSNKTATAIELKDKQSFTINGLPDGTSYTVTEATGEYQTMVNGASGSFASGTISTEEKNTEVTLNYVNYSSANLTIEKNVEGAGAETDRAFNFEVELTAPEGVTLEKDTYEFRLKDGGEYKIENVPFGTTYTVTEESYSGDSYQTTSSVTDATGAELNAGGSSVEGTMGSSNQTATFTNFRTSGNLNVMKVVENGISTDSFGITLTLTNPGGTAINKVTMETYNADGTSNGSQTLNNENGTYNFSLTAGQTASFTAPDGAKYTVTENMTDAQSAQYTGSVSVNGVAKTAAEGTVLEGNDNKVDVVITNTIKTGNLKVGKKVAGDSGAPEQDFTFTLDVEAPAGVTVEGMTYSGLTVADGAMTFTLKDGENKIIEGLPVGTTWELKETEVTLESGSFKATVNDKEADENGVLAAGTIAADDAAVTVVNTYTAPSSDNKTNTNSNTSNNTHSHSHSHSSGGSSSTGTVVTTAIQDESVPLAPGLEEILEEDVPLAGLPKTGDKRNAAAGLMLLSGLALAVLTLVGFRKKEDEE